METLEFRSKIDLFLLIVLAGTSIACLTAGAYAFLVDSSMSWPVAIMAIVVGAGLPLWLLVSTRYELSATDLYIFSGPFSWRVPLREVKSISPTRSVLASPALSFDRLRIDHGRFDSIMISPREKDRFIDELEARRAALS